MRGSKWAAWISVVALALVLMAIEGNVLPLGLGAVLAMVSCGVLTVACCRLGLLELPVAAQAPVRERRAAVRPQAPRQKTLPLHTVEHHAKAA